jgi:pimeloyl-ACP methyl ester carboxylesterase
MESKTADLGDVQLHYVSAGAGEPVVLLHGWPTTWYEWRDVIPVLAERYHVIAPDLRGLGDSSRPESGYDKRTVSEDVWLLVHDVLGHESWHLVGHDWGGPTAYSLAAAHPDSVRRLVIVDGHPPTEENPWPPEWHHAFHAVPDLPETLVAGREELYLRWFFDNVGHPSYEIPAEAMAEYLRTYSQPEALRAGFEYYRALGEDMRENSRLARTPLPMPVLAIQVEGPFGRDPELRFTENEEAERMRQVATDVGEAMIPDAGHWVLEEKPEAVAALIVEFLAEAGG